MEEESSFNELADLKNRRAKKIGPAMDRLPPNDVGSEQGIIGCILLSPSDCLPDVIQRFGEDGRQFYDLRHQEIYRAMLRLWSKRTPIDLITLQHDLKTEQKMDMAGGLAYVASLPDVVPSAANLEYYLSGVEDKYILRKSVQTFTGAVSRIFDYEGDVPALLDEIERDVLAIGQEMKTKNSQTTKELVQEAIAKIEEYHQNKGALDGIPTGFFDFDKMTTGLHGGEMIVVAARPATGKSTWGMNVADHVATDLGLPVGVFSLEMTSRQLMMRTICSRARVNIRNVKDGLLAARDFPALADATIKLSNSPIHIDDTAGLTVMQLRARARRMWKQFGIKLFVIDYLQLLHGTKKRIESRQQEVAEISIGVKDMAKELDVPVIVLAQLNREVEKRGEGARPRMSDLRESGAIENDADLIGFLFKEKPDDAEHNEAVAVKLFVGKHRNGPTGDVDLTFLKAYTRFESAAKISPSDMPEQSRAPYSD